MVDDETLKRWFCEEVLPLERSLMTFIERNWRSKDDIADLRQDIYERTLTGARCGLPTQTRAYLYTVARNHLINCAKRSMVVSFELYADLDEINGAPDFLATDRYLSARAELNRAQAGLNRLPPRCREVVLLRKVEGLSTREAAEKTGVSVHTIEKQLTMGMRALVEFMLGGSGKIARKAPMAIVKEEGL